VIVMQLSRWRTEVPSPRAKTLRCDTRVHHPGFDPLGRGRLRTPRHPIG